MSYHDYRRLLRKRWLLATAFLMFVSGWGLAVAQAQAWPDYDALWKLKVIKRAGAEMTDPFWAHLHAGHAGFETVTLGVEVTQTFDPNPRDPLTVPAGHQLRYTAHGVPLSPWLDPPWTFVLEITNPALEHILDGIHDVNFELQGPNRIAIRPLPMYLHIHRGRAVDPTVPILAHNATTNYDDYETTNSQGPGVIYAKRADRHDRGYPADPTVVPWHLPPSQADLYQEEMQPHTDLFLPAQMWWEEPLGTVSAGMSFIRGIGSKFGGDHRKQLYDAVYDNPENSAAFGLGGHRNLPFKDGPRGIGWASPFITGQVDSQGGLAFAESGGPVRYMKADGELITVAGWRVKPGKDPIWILKPLNYIRANMELRGTWLNGQYTDPADRGFHYPTDVAIDPKNENIWYVAGFGDNVIWKVAIADRMTWNATVSVFAGSIVHQGGYKDGQGTEARLNGPVSLVFDPVCDCLYVADQTNNSIRKITRTGLVTTMFGGPGDGARLAARGLPQGIVNPLTGEYGCWPDPPPMSCYDEVANRAVANLDISLAQAQAGMQAEVYLPMTVRVDSKGRLVILDMGYAAIIRVDPVTGESKKLGVIPGRYDRFVLGWAWLDVDRWGNSGPLDSIYWLQGVASGPLDGEDPTDHHVNEVFAWLPAEGGQSKWLSGKDWSPYPDGWGKLRETDMSHYPWLIAVDPRGALFTSGMGEHGITRIRSRRASDPTPTNWGDFMAGKMLWLKGEPLGGHSFSFKFGHGAHNYLGFADAWGLQPGVTDAELIATFEIPQSIQATANRLSTVLNYIRLNAGKQLGTAPPVPGDTQPPTTPTGVQYSALTSTSLTLTWSASTDNVGVTAYQLTRNGVALPDQPGMSRTEILLLPSTVYTYTVRAVDAAGNVSPVAQIVVTTPAGVVLPAPTEVMQTWERNNTKLVCTASGQFKSESLQMVDTCVKQFP